MGMCACAPVCVSVCAYDIVQGAYVTEVYLYVNITGEPPNAVWKKR